MQKKKTVRIINGRVAGFGYRKVDPQATKRVVSEAIAKTQEGIDYAAALDAMRAVAPCKCNRARQADPVDAVRWHNDVTTCKARIDETREAYQKKYEALYQELRQVFPLREDESESDNVEQLQSAFTALKPAEILRPDGTVEIDAEAVAAIEAKKEEARKQKLFADFMAAKIEELDAR
jgi:hypothetical protein